MDSKKLFSSIGWCYAIYLMVEVVIKLILVNIAKYVTITLSGNMDMILSMVIMYGIAFPIFLVCIKKIKTTPLIREEMMNKSELIMWILLCFGFGYGGNLISQILMFLVEIITGISVVNPVELLIYEINLPVMFLTTVIIAPIMEELMFRKLLLDRIGFIGEFPAVMFSGLLFAVFHGNLYQFVYAFLVGSIFAFIYCKTRNIKYSIFIHMGVNFTGGFFPAVLIQTFEDNPTFATLGIIAQLFFVLVMLVSSIVTFFTFARYEKFQRSYQYISMKDIITTSGVMVCFVIQLFFILWQ